MHDENESSDRPSCGTSEVFRGEENVRRRTDEQGREWFKVYFGSGAHFRNWHDQCIEIYGEENVMVEEVRSPGFRCFEGGKAYRIWARKPDAGAS